MVTNATFYNEIIYYKNILKYYPSMTSTGIPADLLIHRQAHILFV